MDNMLCQCFLSLGHYVYHLLMYMRFDLNQRFDLNFRIMRYIKIDILLFILLC